MYHCTEKSYDHYFNLVHVENVDKQRRQFTSENDVVAKERKETNETRRITKTWLKANEPNNHKYIGGS